MVGQAREAEGNSSRIFQQCYVKCCRLQNLTPLAALAGGAGARALDFSVDRVKYADWPPVLNALSCDLSLHSVTIKCRHPVRTVLEHIDCERLAKTVTKRPVILTKFMLTNLVEATAQLLTGTTLLTALTLDGLPLKVPYLNPLCEALLLNASLRRLSLARCGLGDAGCLALCRAVRCLPHLAALDLTACELTAAGAQHIADLIKYQKIHRYSENWCHTLRYGAPRLEAQAGLRRVALAGNALGHAGAAALLDALADDLWIKEVVLAECGLDERAAALALRTLGTNPALAELDLRRNAAVPRDALARLARALRDRGPAPARPRDEFAWYSDVSGSSSDCRLNKPVGAKTGVMKQRAVSNVRTVAAKYTHKTTAVEKDQQYLSALEAQLAEETCHRRQLEQLNAQLLQQVRAHSARLWTQPPRSSDSERSLGTGTGADAGSGSASSGSSVRVEHSTLAYIQRAFRDIYAFIEHNQCTGECTAEAGGAAQTATPLSARRARSSHAPAPAPPAARPHAHSAHELPAPAPAARRPKTVEMIERQIGDSMEVHSNVVEEMVSVQTKKLTDFLGAPHEGSGATSDSDTLVSPSRRSTAPSPRRRTPALTPRRSSPPSARAPTPRTALFSDDDYDD